MSGSPRLGFNGKNSIPPSQQSLMANLMAMQPPGTTPPETTSPDASTFFSVSMAPPSQEQPYFGGYTPFTDNDFAQELQDHPPFKPGQYSGPNDELSYFPNLASNYGYERPFIEELSDTYIIPAPKNPYPETSDSEISSGINFEIKKENAPQKSAHPEIPSIDITILCEEINAGIQDEYYRIDESFFDSICCINKASKKAQSTIRATLQQEKFKSNLQTLLNKKILQPKQISTILAGVKDFMGIVMDALVSTKDTFPDLIGDDKFSAENICLMLTGTGRSIGSAIETLAQYKDKILSLLKERYSADKVAQIISKKREGIIMTIDDRTIEDIKRELKTKRQRTR